MASMVGMVHSKGEDSPTLYQCLLRLLQRPVLRLQDKAKGMVGDVEESRS